MPCLRSALPAISLAILTFAPAVGAQVGKTRTLASSSGLLHADVAVPGREQDARVAAIAFRLARAGIARCPQLVPGNGLILQHLSQFRPADRAGQAASLSLDRGPGVAVVVPGAPAAMAGVEAGDVVLAIGGRPVPAETGLDRPFDADAARSRADAVLDLLDRAGPGPFSLDLLRNGATLSVRLTPVPVCPSRVHLARSAQVNAYADGIHVFLTSRLVSLADTDDQLAFIVGHEMAHNVLGHAALLRAADVERGIGRALGAKGALVKRTEDEADALGAELMLDAGYNPVAGAAVLNQAGGALRIGFLDDHRSASDRIAAVRALVAARSRH